MKKLIALFLAGVLCATAAYTAIAAEEDELVDTEEVVTTEEEDVTAAEPEDQEPVETEESQLSDLVIALEGDEDAQEIADNIADAVKNGATKEDVNELLVALADYINGKGFDVADIKRGKGKQIMGAFLEDCGVDSEALGAAFDDVGQVIDNVFGSDDAASAAGAGFDAGAFDGAGSDAAGSAAESYAVYGVESTTIPDTGFAR